MVNMKNINICCPDITYWKFHTT